MKLLYGSKKARHSLLIKIAFLFIVFLFSIKYLKERSTASTKNNSYKAGDIHKDKEDVDLPSDAGHPFLKDSDGMHDKDSEEDALKKAKNAQLEAVLYTDRPVKDDKEEIKPAKLAPAYKVEETKKVDKIPKPSKNNAPYSKPEENDATPKIPYFINNSSATSHSEIINIKHKPRVALVLPFIPSQVNRLKNQFSLWNSASKIKTEGFEKQNACDVKSIDKNPYFANFTIVWYIDTTFTEDLKYHIHKEILPGLGEMRNCFTGNIFIGAEVPQALNHHPCGPCDMFFKLFGLLEGFDYFMIMEPDVTPIRPYWLESISREVFEFKPSDRFWMKGSNAQCNPNFGNLDRRQDFHINGNGLFRLNDEGFNEYIERVKAFYPGGMESNCPPGCSTGYGYEGGHDHTLYRYRLQPENFNYIKSILHKFQISPFIVNLCQDMYHLSEIRLKYPDTYLIHSKGPYIDKDVIAIREAYQKILKIYTDPSEEGKFLSKIRHKEMTIQDVHIALCNTKHYLENYHQKGKGAQICKDLCFNMTNRNMYEELCSNDFFNYWNHYFPDKLYIWNTDFHAAPIGCNQNIYEEAGSIVHAEVDFPNCIFYNVCKQRLKTLRFDNWKGFSLDPCPNRLRREFFETYFNDPEFKRVDIFICSHPAANCELYMPFNRTIIIYATTRIEFGRNDEKVYWRKPLIDGRSRYRWEDWINNLKKLAEHPTNIIAANNMYDAKYIEYFTGIKARYLPSWCGIPNNGHQDLQYNPTSSEIIIGPYRDNLGHPYRSEKEAWKHPIMQGLTDALNATNSELQFVRLRQKYGKYEKKDLLTHPAIVLIPYQASFMSFFEYYRLGIPIFAPSKRLLLEWEANHDVMWERIYGTPEEIGKKHLNLSNPNDKNGFKDWVGFCDFYVFPHIQYFDSWRDLVDNYSRVDLKQVSARMLQFNMKEKGRLINEWKEIFDNVKALGKRTIPSDFDEAMYQLYKILPLGRDSPGKCPK